MTLQEQVEQAVAKVAMKAGNGVAVAIDYEVIRHGNGNTHREWCVWVNGIGLWCDESLDAAVERAIREMP